MSHSSWFDKVNDFKKEVNTLIESSEKSDLYIYDIRLQDMVENLTKCIPQIKMWSKVYSRLKKFEAHLKAEFDVFDAQLYIDCKEEMILKQDDRKRKKLKVYDFTSTEIKMLRETNKLRQEYMHKLIDIQVLLFHIENSYFWTANKIPDVLKTMSKFSIASEKVFK